MEKNRNLEKLTITESDRFEPIEKLRAMIRKSFVGQEWAVNETVRRISRRLAGISDPNLPIANLFIAGPTGVGKTEFAKVLANCWEKDVIFQCTIPSPFCGWEIHEEEIEEFAKKGQISPQLATALTNRLDSYRKGREETPLACPRCQYLNQIRKIGDGPVGRLIPKEQDNLIFIDCTQFGGTSSHNIARLIGAPPGYIGYTDKPLLHPRNLMGGVKVILWDEFDKGIIGHLSQPTDLPNIILRILEEGKTTVNIGSDENLSPEVSLRNVINVLTSNIGSRQIRSRFEGGRMGFVGGKEKPLSQYTNGELRALNDAIYAMVKKEVEKTLTPELFNRITFSGRLIVFRFLRDAEYLEILNRHVLTEVQKKLAQRGLNIRIEYSPEALNLILKETGEDRQYGARPLKALGDRWIVDKIADFINYGKLQPGDTVVVKTEMGFDEELNEERERLAFFLVENGQDQKEKA